jgi:hypothetical protein
LDGIARLDKQVVLEFASLDRSRRLTLLDSAILTDLHFDLRNIANAIAEREMRFSHPQGRENKTVQRHTLSMHL